MNACTCVMYVIHKYIVYISLFIYNIHIFKKKFKLAVAIIEFLQCYIFYALRLYNIV